MDLTTKLKNSVIRQVTKFKESKAQRIISLKAILDSTDYKILKCYEYQLVNKEPPYDIEALHISREATREQINELEGE